ASRERARSPSRTCAESRPLAESGVTKKVRRCVSPITVPGKSLGSCSVCVISSFFFFCAALAAWSSPHARTAASPHTSDATRGRPHELQWFDEHIGMSFPSSRGTLVRRVRKRPKYPWYRIVIPAVAVLLLGVGAWYGFRHRSRGAPDT